MNTISRQVLRNFKRRIQKRLTGQILEPSREPMFTAGNIQYEVAERTRALSCAGIGAIHQMVRAVGLVDAIDRDVRLLKVHLPYHESDHVLNIAYNILAGGACLQDLELLRNNEVYMDALGARRIPDPTTAGDFCRRFETDGQIIVLMEVINQIRTKVWKQQPKEFFGKAVLHADGTVAPTFGECKQGMDRSYKAIGLCREAGFLSVLMLGDTDFTQTAKLDGWDEAGDVKFIFGVDAMPNLKRLAGELPEGDWKRLARSPRYQVKTREREKPQNVKERIVREREYENMVLQCEDIAEFQYRPGNCKRAYRMVALRKLISVEKGRQQLFTQYRYFFYITNERDLPVEQVVFTANDRCDQENLIEQLKNGVHAMGNQLDNLHSNWAYMVMASLAWTLKSWFGLLTPAPAGPHRKRHEAQKQTVVKMEFRRFVNSLIHLPCQIVRTGRRIVYRLLSWNPWVDVLPRTSEAMRLPLRC